MFVRLIDIMLGILQLPIGITRNRTMKIISNKTVEKYVLKNRTASISLCRARSDS